MAKEVLMPKLSSTMETGYVTEWFKKEGDLVRVGEPIFEVMTDKIAIEVEAYDEGVLLKIVAQENEVVPVNSVIAYIGNKGDVIEEKATPIKVEEKASVETQPLQTSAPSAQVLERLVDVKDVRATPAARRLVREKGLNLAEVFQAVQPSPRLVVADVETYVPAVSKSSGVPVATTNSDHVLIPWKGIRKLVKDQMVKSVSNIPHVTEHAVVDARQLLALKNDLSESLNMRITLTHLIAYFTARTLTKHPTLNARTSDEGITVYKQVNLGIATALSEGLIVPVVHAAESQSIKRLAQNMSEVTSKARSNDLSLDKLQGASFTITSLGASRVRHFNPIINYPEVAILGVSGMYDELRFEHDQVIRVPVFTLSLSFDHRAIDGAPAAAFLSDLVGLCEKPAHVIALQ